MWNMRKSYVWNFTCMNLYVQPHMCGIPHMWAFTRVDLEHVNVTHVTFHMCEVLTCGNSHIKMCSLTRVDLEHVKLTCVKFHMCELHMCANPHVPNPHVQFHTCEIMWIFCKGGSMWNVSPRRRRSQARVTFTRALCDRI